MWLAWLQYLQGSPELGLKTLRAALQLGLPDSEWLKSLEMRLRSIELTPSEAAEAIPEARSLLDGNPTAFNAETLAMFFFKLEDSGSALRWQRAARDAARDAEIPTEMIESRLAEYEAGRGPSKVLDRSDIAAARIPLRRVDLQP